MSDTLDKPAPWARSDNPPQASPRARRGNVERRAQRGAPGETARPVIVFWDAYTHLYGAQRSMLALYERWHREGRYRLHFLYIHPGEVDDAVRSLGIGTTHLATGPLLGSFQKKLLNLRWWEYPLLMRELMSFSQTLRRVLRAQGAHLLHCNTDRAGMMSLLGARRARCPMVTHIRRDRSFGRLDRIVHRGSTDLVWVSARIREEFGNNSGIAAPKGRVIFNGRVLADAGEPSTRAELIAELGLPPDARMVLMAAGFDRRKDHETLVKTAEIACREEPRLYFLLAGADLTPGEARRRKIEELVHRADLRRRVLFLGHRKDVGRLMRGVTLVVNSAREEALGGVLIEAIGYGVPCVATDTGGTSEIVPDGLCGYLVPRGDARAMAARLVALLRDDKTRRRFSEQARVHFGERFTVERCAAETATFFDEIIARAAQRRS